MRCDLIQIRLRRDDGDYARSVVSVDFASRRSNYYRSRLEPPLAADAFRRIERPLAEYLLADKPLEHLLHDCADLDGGGNGDHNKRLVEGSTRSDMRSRAGNRANLPGAGVLFTRFEQKTISRGANHHS